MNAFSWGKLPAVADDPVALDYAPPPARKGRGRVCFLMSLFSVGHLLLTFISIAASDRSGQYAWEVLARYLLLSFYFASEYGLLDDVSELFALFVLAPLNSVLYGTVLTGQVLIVRRLRFGRK
jgi:hypothetical protein